MDVDHWLEAQLGPLRLGNTTLVLCRSRATVARVRRHLAERGGAIGVDVLTPHGLVATIHRPPLGAVEPEPEPLPADHPMSRRIGDRPGLIAVARRWVRQVRQLAAVGQPHAAPRWLRDLAATGWAADGSDEAARDALARIRANPLHPTESLRYDRAVLVGFESGLAVLDPLAHAVAAAVSRVAHLGTEPAFEVAPVPHLPVEDVVAEARAATALCLQRPRDTLVLVSDAATARRLRDALDRNGLGAGFVDPPPAAASALGGLVLRLAPWFTEVDPALRVTDVAWVFGHRTLSGALCPPAQDAVDRELEAAGLTPGERPSRRDTAELLREARILDAPLSRWLMRLQVLANQPHRSERVRRAAIALRVRLALLEARATGRAPQEALAAGPSPAWDDFDALVAELLGDAGPALTAAPGAHTLGALRAFLVDLRPRVHDDAAARVVLAALREREGVPADPATVREALGAAIDPPTLGTGVDVLMVDDYDGRPCGRLVVLDVHHQGIARRPTPDPLLDESEQAALGVLAGVDLVDFRVATLHRAAARAGEVVALVARRDAGGRDLVAPIQLDLRPHPSSLGAIGTYGLGLDLPERRRARALERREGGPAERPGEASALALLALQATACWYREGRGPLPDGPRAADRFGGLDERLSALGAPAPAWLMPWLGHAEGVPEAALPNRPWSTSGLFEPLSACLYRAFVGSVLRVERAEEVPEDLDPREVGTAIHDALWELGVGLALRVPSDEVDARREAAVEALRRSTGEKLDAVRHELEGLSDARQAAVDGRQARWHAHWPSWARSRIQAVQERPWVEDRVSTALKGHPYTEAALADLIARPPLSEVASERLRGWLVDQAMRVGKGSDPGTWTHEEVARVAHKHGELPFDLHPGLREFLHTEGFRRVGLAARALGLRAEHGLGELVATGAEIPFGPVLRGAPGQLKVGDEERPTDLGEIVVGLGSEAVSLTGRIDRLVVTRLTSGRPLVELLDYKTGKVPNRTPWQQGQDLRTGRLPQLMVYALALRAAMARLGPEFEGALVASVGWDYVQDTLVEEGGAARSAPNQRGQYLVDDPTLDAVGARLGALLDRGRAGMWTLQPLPDACPHVSGFGAYCDVADACRFRGLPPEEAA